MRVVTTLVLGVGILVGCDEGQAAKDGADTAPTGPAKTDDPNAIHDTVSTTPSDTADAADASEDVPPVTTCAAFAPSGTLVANDAAGVFVLGGTVDLGLGGALPDALVFEFTKNDTGTFVLGTGANDNYSHCSQCVRVVQDIDASGATHAKQFFATGGKLVVSPETPPYGPVIDVELFDLQLSEVTIRAADYLSKLVPDGACYAQAAPVNLATGACVAQCGDHMCGSDGCGGTCGEGCASETCSLDGSKCEPEPTCVELSLYGDLANPAPGVYKLGIDDGGGAHLGAWGQKDFIQVEFYAEGTGRFDLTGVPNDDYATCNQCVRMVVDGDRDFFQADGNLFVQSGSDPTGDPGAGGGALSVVLDGVKLVEVTLDKDTYTTTPVPGGSCAILRAPKPITRAP